MRSRPWFRMHRDITENVKIFKLEPHHFRFWVMFCACTHNDGTLPSDEQNAHRLRLEDGEVRDIADHLHRKGLIDIADDGERRMHDWDEHNPPDGAAGRMRKMRAKRKQIAGNEEPEPRPASQEAPQEAAKTTQSDVTVTPHVTLDVTPRYAGEQNRTEQSDPNGSLSSATTVRVVEVWHPGLKDCQLVVAEWNTFAAKHDLAVVRDLTDARKKAIKARLSKLDGPQVMINAMHLIPTMPFLLGSNDRGWKANFDWFITEKGFTKLRESAFGKARK